MKEDLKKSVWYGIVAFIIFACYFKTVTSPNWEKNWMGDGAPIIIHLGAVFVSMLLGGFVLMLVAEVFKKFPLVMNSIHLRAKILSKSVICGGMFFMCWVGFGMFSFMGAPDNVLNRMYIIGILFSSLVAVIAFPLHYRFWKRNGRLLNMNDFNPMF